MSSEGKLVLAVDVGTTSIRAHLVDRNTKLIASSSRKIELSYPKPDYVELDDKQLWTSTLTVIKECIQDRDPGSISCMGLTCFRCSFITWDRKTGKPFHPFIMWQDVRTKEAVKSWNSSLRLKLIQGGSSLLHAVTRSERFKAGSIMKFMTATVPLRLKWALDNIQELSHRVKDRQVMFGTVDTWLLYKLTGGKIWATDHSNASATLLYDTFQSCWSSLILTVIGIPSHILPPIKNTSDDYGRCDESLFGVAIPITSIVADQQAASFGHCCFEKGDTNITLGTGTFTNVNIGSVPLASITGIYPLVGWSINDSITYLAEAQSKSNGSCVDWLESVGLLEDVVSSSDVAYSVSSSNGVFFIPAFNGLPLPINDDLACGGFIGISAETKREHLIRSVLESLTFVTKLQYDTMVKECGTQLNDIRVDGGVAKNRFVIQMMADLLNRKILVPQCTDMTIRGAALLAGLSTGVWRDLSDIKDCVTRNQEYEVILPCTENHQTVTSLYLRWLDATKRFGGWYKE